MVGIDERDPRRPLLRQRNALMRDWAARDTSGRTAVLDFDALSLAPDAPRGLIGACACTSCCAAAPLLLAQQLRSRDL